jgi:low affinity Fe/Cu permease
VLEALFFGFLRKSVPAALVAAVVLCGPVSHFSSPALMAIAMAVAVITAVVLIVILSGRVNTMEV